MPEPLKHFFSPELVRRLAREIAAVEPTFPVRPFTQTASKGLEELELLDRGRHIAAALSRHLPADYPAAIDVLLRSLGPEHASDELVGAGMDPFFYLPHVLFVAERGLGHFDLSMQAQYELTKRFSAESSIRAYIDQDPERTFAVLRGWATDPNPHVRRLVSEGTRLRLPWAMRVRWLDENPKRVLELLELLKDDPTTLVRRSVANSLNDLGKVHPQLLVKTCKAWSRRRTPERRKLIEHALRSAIKRGEPGALSVLGYAAKPLVAVEAVCFEPGRVAIGSSVEVGFTLRSRARTRQDLLVDLRVHFVGTRGKSSPKVFKLRRVELPAKARVELATTVSLAVHSTRKPRPGRHDVEVVVNGEGVALGAFEVVAPRSDGRRATHSSR